MFLFIDKDCTQAEIHMDLIIFYESVIVIWLK
jgi:hypothetical protein